MKSRWKYMAEKPLKRCILRNMQRECILGKVCVFWSQIHFAFPRTQDSRPEYDQTLWYLEYPFFSNTFKRHPKEKKKSYRDKFKKKYLAMILLLLSAEFHQQLNCNSKMRNETLKTVLHIVLELCRNSSMLKFILSESKSRPFDGTFRHRLQTFEKLKLMKILTISFFQHFFNQVDWKWWWMFIIPGNKSFCYVPKDVSICKHSPDCMSNFIKMCLIDVHCFLLFQSSSKLKSCAKIHTQLNRLVNKQKML